MLPGTYFGDIMYSSNKSTNFAIYIYSWSNKAGGLQDKFIMTENGHLEYFLVVLYYKAGGLSSGWSYKAGTNI